MKINILISTINTGIHKVKDIVLDPREDVEYIISHQYTEDAYRIVPAELQRDDITVAHLEGKGVTKSRNNAIRLATGDVGHFLEDDVIYSHSYIDCVKKTFEDNPELDVALFKIKTGFGEPEYKSYPPKQVKLKSKIFSVSTLEIAINLKSIKESGIRFDERFGAGQKLLIGSDETIFVEDCLKKGLCVSFFPEYVAEHPYISTINSIAKYDKRRAWVTGGYDCRTNGSIALIKAFLGTMKILPDLIKNRANPFSYFYHRISAVIYILRTNHKYK
jgi:hypothetical protein